MAGPRPYKTIISDAQNNLNIAIRYISYLNPLTIRKRGATAKAYFALAAVCFLWGTTWIVSKIAVQHMPAIQMVSIRQFIGGLCYVLFFLFKGAAMPKGRDWIFIIVLSFLNFMLSNAMSTWAVQYIAAGLGSLIGAIFPLWLLIIGLVATGNKISKKGGLGFFLGFVGICLVFYQHLEDFFNPDFRFGIFLSLASTWSWAFGMYYTKKTAANFNPYFGLGLQMMISGVVLYSGSAAAGASVALSTVPWEAWASLAYLIIFGSIFAFMAYLYALQNLPTEEVSIYGYINPIVAVLLGAMIFDEKLTIFIVSGMLITLVGVYLVNRGRTVKKMMEEEEEEVD